LFGDCPALRGRKCFGMSGASNGNTGAPTMENRRTGMNGTMSVCICAKLGSYANHRNLIRRTHKLTHAMNKCPNCPVCAVWRCVQRLVHLFPIRYYKRFRVGRLIVWVFPFWWRRPQAETIIGRTYGPITYYLKANAKVHTPLPVSASDETGVKP